ncbi:dihydrofolate reductase-like domain-containing protein [Powellomyces hirtus]|nr:dihydrofolate reductase-like domain-containing protein [Powellomyces hirtus]
MQRPHFTVYLGLSLDGYIASPAKSRGTKFLDQFPSGEVLQRFRVFLSTIDTIIMGRVSYIEAINEGFWEPAFDVGRVIVLTHQNQPLPALPTGSKSSVSTVQFGSETAVEPVVEFAEKLYQAGSRRVYLYGGAKSIAPFHRAGVVDRWTLGYAPILLGAGISLWETIAKYGGASAEEGVGKWQNQLELGEKLRLSKSEVLSNGILEVTYDR